MLPGPGRRRWLHSPRERAEGGCGGQGHRLRLLRAVQCHQPTTKGNTTGPTHDSSSFSAVALSMDQPPPAVQRRPPSRWLSGSRSHVMLLCGQDWRQRYPGGVPNRTPPNLAEPLCSVHSFRTALRWCGQARTRRRRRQLRPASRSARSCSTRRPIARPPAAPRRGMGRASSVTSRHTRPSP